jgi:hypothetical protein
MSIRRFIEHNYWLKLFSLMLATLIWFIVWTLAVQTGKRGDEIKVLPQSGPAFLQSGVIVTGEFSRLPVFVLSSAAEPRSFRVEPADVKVVVSGEKDLVASLSKNDIQAVVDLTERQSTNAFAGTVRVNTPPGVKLVKVEPPAVRVDRVPAAVPAPLPIPSPSLSPAPGNLGPTFP